VKAWLREARELAGIESRRASLQTEAAADTFKALEKQLKLPRGGRLNGAHWEWRKKGGFPPEPALAQVEKAADGLHWHRTDGPLLKRGDEKGQETKFKSPEGHELSLISRSGVSKVDGFFRIGLDMAVSEQTTAGRVMPQTSLGDDAGEVWPGREIPQGIPPEEEDDTLGLEFR
jgi:hypothetical protein